MTSLAQAYLHLKIDASYKELWDVKEYLHSIGNKYASEIYNQDFQVKVQIEEGSVKTWITIAGALYYIISQYGSFRTGLDYMVKDAYQFGNSVTSDFIKTAKIKKEKIYRVERRLGIPGKISRILARIDHLEQANPGNQEVQRESEAIRAAIQSIVNDLDDEKDKELFYSNIPGTYIPNRQFPPNRPAIGHESSFIIRPDQESDGTLTDFSNNIHQHLQHIRK